MLAVLHPPSAKTRLWSCFPSTQPGWWAARGGSHERMDFRSCPMKDGMFTWIWSEQIKITWRLPWGWPETWEIPQQNRHWNGNIIYKFGTFHSYVRSPEATEFLRWDFVSFLMYSNVCLDCLSFCIAYYWILYRNTCTFFLDVLQKMSVVSSPKKICHGQKIDCMPLQGGAPPVINGL